ncbi:RHS repeat-associated core domain-containing protein [Sulfurovum mangrovi]|uniref:RHS repeat-associated core domain-containing protein n=1 Tax=Sulfurovum mangrovi TaxID=2893889 RepID=UPI001E5BD380|nr:RHS repeat-associated core domain-containing protein [Sulfurovum mangrovi]UFH60178.1 hypothetical protein LN246_04850 [Sulfurovum mangrovi]
MIEWDEENRIKTVTDGGSDNGHTSYYVYDASGERSLKRTAQGETFYVNPYFVIREGEVASKHFFAGSQRIATKLTKQESQTVHGKGGSNKPQKIIYEKEQYFYHPDHLGSSSFVTDERGKVYEHLEYFPYGETFAHEHSNTQVTPYRFTGKELDEVTGLYYYGARYYDPRTSVWQSPDPILGEYMSGQGNAGVFNPKNLSLFTYTYNNPVNLVDPDGMLTKEEGAAISDHVYGEMGSKLPGHIQQVTNEKELNRYGVSQTDLVNESTGFASGIYKNTNTGEVTMAFRGTNDGKDMKANLVEGITASSSQYAQAKRNASKFAKATKGMDTAFTGHSLGGGLAAAASEATGIEAKTYNAAGVHPMTVIFGHGIGNIDNYYVVGEALTTLQNSYTGLGVLMPDSSGRQHPLVPPSLPKSRNPIDVGGWSFEMHKMSSVKSALGVE